MKPAILFQRAEGVAIFIASFYFYQHLDFNILLFVLFLLIVDISMFGYLFNNKVGAYTYNFGHSLIAPSLLLIVSVMSDIRLLLAASLIWLAHIGMDRALGYGLKYESGFKHTHLGDIGKK